MFQTLSGNRHYFWMKLHPFWITWIIVLVLHLDIPGSHGVKNRDPSTCIKRYQKLVALISLWDRKSSNWRLASICKLVDLCPWKIMGVFLCGKNAGQGTKTHGSTPAGCWDHSVPTSSLSYHILKMRCLPLASLSSRLLGIQPDPTQETSYYIYGS